jgi:hypothetical protein
VRSHCLEWQQRETHHHEAERGLHHLARLKLEHHQTRRQQLANEFDREQTCDK